MGSWRSFSLQIVCSLENFFSLILLVDCLGSSASKFLGLLQEKEKKKLFFHFHFYLTSLLLLLCEAFLKRLLITNIKYFLIKSSGDESLFFCCFGFTGNGVSSFTKIVDRSIRKRNITNTIFILKKMMTENFFSTFTNFPQEITQIAYMVFLMLLFLYLFFWLLMLLLLRLFPLHAYAPYARKRLNIKFV